MNATPKALRLHIGLFGRTNTGKSSFLNLITGQDFAIVSDRAGTTTDVVRKSMELLPLGPVTFLDTAGVDDGSDLGSLRTGKTREALASADVAILVTEPNAWTEYEEELAAACAAQKTPVIIAVNKTDLATPDPVWLAGLSRVTPHVMTATCAGPDIAIAGQGGEPSEPSEAGEAEKAAASEARREARREATLLQLKRLLLAACPEDFLNPPAILGDLLPSGAGLPVVVLIVPIDLQAPKGRLILPQVQAIRDALDSDAAVAVVKEREYRAFLDRLASPPELVACDSQIALKMAADTPEGIPATTFSILFSRFKGDIVAMAEGAAALERLGPGNRVLVAEACTHHALEDDIGRVKIPRWIRQYTGADVEITHACGKDYPADLAGYDLVVHCGACSLTRREMLMRIERARAAGVAVTNYGMAISALQGVIERTLSPFPAALEAYRERLAEGAPAEPATGRGR